ncbi:MAG: STAS domain-containing protein [Actinomycetes bacterium]
MRLRHRGRDLVVAISGELDLWTAQTVRLTLRDAVPASGARLVLDLSGVTTCDAAGLAVLVGELRRVPATGGATRLASPSPSVDQVLRATGMGRVVPVLSSVDEALSE